MTSATVELWKDTGYTEGCFEVPSPTATYLKSPDYEYEDLEIPTSALFSELKLRASVGRLLQCSYLRLTVYWNNGGTGTFYGWVDKVSVASDTEDSPMTRVQWHVDLWRTYIDKVTLGAGIVKRRTASGDLPPQSYGNRYTLTKTARDILPTSTIKWVLLNLTKTVSGTTTTQTYVYPVDLGDQQGSESITIGSDSVICPSFEDTLTGRFDEVLGIDPDAIFGAFISPVPPSAATEGANGWSMEAWDGIKTDKGFAVFVPGYSHPPYQPQGSTTMAQTTDTVAYVVTDMDMQAVGALPWGISVNRVTYRTVNCDTAAYLSIRFSTSLDPTGPEPLNGLEFTIPLKTIGVTTNAKSSYVYSGQQELDREQMAIQRQQALYSGLGSIANQAIQGAMGGAMIGVATGGSAAMGAGIGGGSSGVGGAISTVTDYFVSGWANDKMMDATIRQKARQTSYMTLPSSGTDWLYYGHSPQLVPLQWDDYSITQRTQDMTLYGAHVEEPRSSCQSLLTAGGPLQIANCTVTGSVPPEAKRYIKDRLASGVRIV